MFFICNLQAHGFCQRVWHLHHCSDGDDTDIYQGSQSVSPNGGQAFLTHFLWWVNQFVMGCFLCGTSLQFID